MMARSTLGALALLLGAACGGGGAPAPSVRSNTEEVQGKREEIKSAGEAPVDSSGEVLALLKSMDEPDPEVRWRAEFALGRVGPRGLKGIAEALKHENPRIRFAAAFVLGAHGAKAKPAIPTLLEALSDKEDGVRVWSAKSLSEIDLDDPRVTAALIKALRDPFPDVRRVALAVVIRLGPKGTGAATALVDLLQDADAGIRAMACLALRQLGTDGKVAIPALVARLSDPDADVRDRAAQALRKTGPEGVGPLSRALRDRDPKVRRAAADVLGSYGAEAKDASADLTDLSKDADPAVLQAAADALKKIQNDAGDAQAIRGTPYLEGPEVVARRVAGFKWAKFGLFIPWGLYSVPARAKPGQAADWILENEKLPAREYERYAGKFSADKFKADEWSKLANEAGARYVVLTAKHHDGFCLWNTRLTDYNVMRMAAARRDLVGELAAACEKDGVKFCAYYSLLDWHHPDYREDFAKYVDYAHGQVKELLANYPLWGVWFDGEWDHLKDEWRGDDLLVMVRRSRPNAFVNDRLGRETRNQIRGVDFYTQEQELSAAALRLEGKPVAWETRVALGGSPSYTESPDPFKSAERILREMVDAVSKGGNFLLSVGPRADGTIPEPVQARLKVIGEWMKKNGEAIYDTERSPFNGPLPAGRVTCKATRLYVFLEELPRNGIITLPGLKTKVREAWVVDGKRELKVRDTGIQAPGDLVDGPFTVVGIELEGPPEVVR
jgi:alpha-L-fucosidase